MTFYSHLQKLAGILFFALLHLVPCHAFASVTTYTSEAAYIAALPSNNNIPTIEDFSSVTANYLMSQTSGDAWNGFSVTATGSSIYGSSGYCPALSDPQASTPTSCVGYNTSAPNVPGIVGSFGTPSTGGGAVTFNPTGKAFAFAFDFVDWNDGYQRSSLVVNFSDGSSLPITGPTNADNAPPQFFGFILDLDSRAAGVHISNLTWVGIDDELVGFYNVKTSRLLPEITTSKTIAPPVLQPDDSYHVEITIDSENTGGFNLDFLELSDDIAATTNFGSAFISVIGSPVISVIDDPVSSLVAVAPNPSPTAYTGTSSQPNFFDGASGYLGVGDIVRVVLTVKIDPTAAGAPNPLLNTALFSALDPVGGLAEDMSDSTSPADDTGGSDDPSTVVFPLLAVAETFTSINGAAGGDTVTILTSDTQYNVPIVPANVTIAIDAIDAVLSLNTSTGIITVGAGTALGSYDITYTICEIVIPTNCSSTTETITVLGSPMLDAQKTVTMFGTSGSGAYALPGNDVIYTISVTNLGDGPVDVDSIKLVDALPAEITFWNGDIDFGGSDNYPETTPVAFTQSTGAGLSFTYSSDVRFGFGAIAPSDFDSCSSVLQDNTYRDDVTFICLNPKGAMNAGTPNPSISLSFRAAIK